MNLRAAKETLSSDLKNSSNSGAKISVIERDKNLYVKKILNFFRKKILRI